MRRVVLIMAWIAVFVAAVFLRFDGLSRRPFHADEATGARITAHRMESTGGRFDPRHYHGPLLADLAIPVCRLQGENGWSEMTKGTLRAVTATIGCLLILVPLCWRRRLGDLPALWAGAFLATSPLLVYFSRMFIHETLLVAFGLLVVATVVVSPRWGIPGLMLGLMFAVKESFVISVMAWIAAVFVLMLENRSWMDRQWLRKVVADWWLPVFCSGLAALLVSLFEYTHGFTHWRGAVDAVRTFFVYETVTGHDKPVGYYLELLLWPRELGGVWWYGTPVAVLALVAYVRSFGNTMSLGQRRLVRFLAYAALGHFVIYSLIAYKTPWLMCLPWAHVCWLAGCSVCSLPSRSRMLAWTCGVVAALVLFSQWHQARMATGRLESNSRNPFAYVPTRRDVESLAEWLQGLQIPESVDGRARIAVIGSNYWPLPWYLKGFDRVGCWPEVPKEGVSDIPLILVTAERVEEVKGQTGQTHEVRFSNLRSNELVWVFIRKDLMHIPGQD